jgi:hypothetical protein
MAKNLPDWAGELVEQYESGASCQFVLHGNVEDHLLLPLKSGPELGGLSEFVQRVLVSSFDVVLTYDLGNGIRTERDANGVFNDWPTGKEFSHLPREPRRAMETLTRFMRYCSNLRKLKPEIDPQVAVVIKASHLVIPSLRGGLNYDLNAMAMLVRDWATEEGLSGLRLATFLITDNLNDLHPLVVENPRASKLAVGLPTASDLEQAMGALFEKFPKALANYEGKFEIPAGQLTGATLSAIEGLLKSKQHKGESLEAEDLSALKKELVEQDCQGLIEFIDSSRTLDDVYGQEAVKEWIRQDIALWQQGDIGAMPMGYLLCGPVGTGKTYMVECLAGEAGVPVVKFKNFRDRWVGSTEGNLEKIFSLLHALGRCVVFIDEADQALGKRDSGSGDSGVSGRVYSMMAKEMSDSDNRGKILWILASSRPDLIEVDLKRPGRVDVKIPLFPSGTPEEGFFLIRALCRKHRVKIPKSALEEVRDLVPDLVTPGAAESLAIKVYRLIKTKDLDPVAALKDCLDEYQNPVPAEILDFQIGLAVGEASDLSFVPERFRRN